jgi:hypothetical protein
LRKVKVVSCNFLRVFCQFHSFCGFFFFFFSTPRTFLFLPASSRTYSSPSPFSSKIYQSNRTCDDVS